MECSFYREIINDHNLRPSHKKDLQDSNLELRGVNPSCGDNIMLKLRIKDGVIEDGAYTGDGCAISQASADMMLDLIIGKKEDEARRLADIFFRMIKGEASEDEIEELEEASALKDVSHMPARVKCAVLSWHTVDNMIVQEQEHKHEGHEEELQAKMICPHCKECMMKQ